MNKQAVDFYEIYDYYYQPLMQRSFFRITIIFLIIILISAAAFFLIKYFFRKKRERELLAWEWAFRELKSLKPEGCATKKEFKNFYFDLTNIIKNYFNKRYDWNTQDKTDEELLIYLQNKNFDVVLLNQLTRLVEGALWVKFADEEALKIQVDKDFKTAFEIVEKTIEKKNDKNKN